LLALVDTASFISRQHERYTIYADNCYLYSFLILRLAAKSINRAEPVPESHKGKHRAQGKLLGHTIASAIPTDKKINQLYEEYRAHRTTHGTEASCFD
jgi:hypothetical protein